MPILSYLDETSLKRLSCKHLELLRPPGARRLTRAVATKAMLYAPVRWCIKPQEGSVSRIYTLESRAAEFLRVALVPTGLNIPTSIRQVAEIR